MHGAVGIDLHDEVLVDNRDRFIVGVAVDEIVHEKRHGPDCADFNG